MKVYIMLPFIVLHIDDKRDEYLSALTDDYAEQFSDAKYVYPARSKLIGREVHSTGSRRWMYTKIPPQAFKLYEGGET